MPGQPSPKLGLQERQPRVFIFIVGSRRPTRSPSPCRGRSPAKTTDAAPEPSSLEKTTVAGANSTPQNSLGVVEPAQVKPKLKIIVPELPALADSADAQVAAPRPPRPTVSSASPESSTVQQSGKFNTSVIQSLMNPYSAVQDINEPADEASQNTEGRTMMAKAHDIASACQLRILMSAEKYRRGEMLHSYAELRHSGDGAGSLSYFKSVFPGDRFRPPFVDSAPDYACGLRAVYVSWHEQFKNIPGYDVLTFEHLVGAAPNYDRQLRTSGGTAFSATFFESAGDSEIMWLHNDNAAHLSGQAGSKKAPMNHWSGLAPIAQDSVAVQMPATMSTTVPGPYASESTPSEAAALLLDEASITVAGSPASDSTPLETEDSSIMEIDPVVQFPGPDVATTIDVALESTALVADDISAAPDTPSNEPNVASPITASSIPPTSTPAAEDFDAECARRGIDRSVALCNLGETTQEVGMGNSDPASFFHFLDDFPGEKCQIITVDDRSLLSGVRTIDASWNRQFAHQKWCKDLTLDHLLRYAIRDYRDEVGQVALDRGALAMILYSAIDDTLSIETFFHLARKIERKGAIIHDYEDLNPNNLVLSWSCRAVNNATDTSAPAPIDNAASAQEMQQDNVAQPTATAPTTSTSPSDQTLKTDSKGKEKTVHFDTKQPSSKSTSGFASQKSMPDSTAKNSMSEVTHGPLFRDAYTQGPKMDFTTQMTPEMPNFANFGNLSGNILDSFANPASDQGEMVMTDAHSLDDLDDLDDLAPSGFSMNVDMSEAPEQTQQPAPNTFGGYQLSNIALTAATIDKQVDMGESNLPGLVQKPYSSLPSSSAYQKGFNPVVTKPITQEVDMNDNPLAFVLNPSSSAPGLNFNVQAAEPKKAGNIANKSGPVPTTKTFGTGLNASKFAPAMSPSASMDVDKQHSTPNKVVKFDLPSSSSEKKKKAPFARAKNDAELQDMAAKQVAMGLNLPIDDDMGASMPSIQEKKGDLSRRNAASNSARTEYELWKSTNGKGVDASNWDPAGKKVSTVLVPASPEKNDENSAPAANKIPIYGYGKGPPDELARALNGLAALRAEQDAKGGEAPAVPLIIPPPSSPSLPSPPPPPPPPPVQPFVTDEEVEELEWILQSSGEERVKESPIKGRKFAQPKSRKGKKKTTIPTGVPPGPFGAAAAAPPPVSNPFASISTLAPSPPPLSTTGFTIAGALAAQKTAAADANQPVNLISHVGKVDFVEAAKQAPGGRIIRRV